MPTLRPPLLPALLLLAACPGDPGEEATGGDASGGSEDSGDVAAPTYWQDVAPIYFTHCVTCHQPGGIAPMRLDTAADARLWAAASADAVAARTMPPWLITADGSCGEFAGSRALADADIATISAWADAGAPAGEPRDDLAVPPQPHLDAGLDLHTPEFVPEVVGGPLAEFDEYRCFAVDPKLAGDTFITGFEVTPGNAPLVHHALALVVDPEHVTPSGQTNAEVMQAMDADSPGRDGWPCFSGAGEGVDAAAMPVVWAPGMGAVEFPRGTGVRLGERDVVVVQIHYNLHDADREGQSDRTRVRLRTADEVARPAAVDFVDLFIDTLFTGAPATLAPGEASVKYTWDVDIGAWYVEGEGEVEVHGIFPHMHERGRRWRAELLEDGRPAQCVGDVQAWDFDWQLFYFYERPLVLRPGTRLRVTCEFDTRDAPAPITPGWGTQNEMCLAGLFVVP